MWVVEVNWIAFICLKSTQKHISLPHGPERNRGWSAYVRENRASALRLIDNLPTGIFMSLGSRIYPNTNEPPNSVDNFLACRTLDEVPRLAKNGHFYRIAYTIFKVVIQLFTRTRD